MKKAGDAPVQLTAGLCRFLKNFVVGGVNGMGQT